MYDLRSYESNFCNCVEKPEKFRTSTRFEPMTSFFRLLYAIAKIALITAKILASLDMNTLFQNVVRLQRKHQGWCKEKVYTELGNLDVVKQTKISWSFTFLPTVYQ